MFCFKTISGKKHNSLIYLVSCDSFSKWLANNRNSRDNELPNSMFYQNSTTSFRPVKSRQNYSLYTILQIKAEVEWSEVKWSEVKWSEVKWSEVKWSEVKWSEVKWSEVKWSEVSRMVDFGQGKTETIFFLILMYLNIRPTVELLLTSISHRRFTYKFGYTDPHYTVKVLKIFWEKSR